MRESQDSFESQCIYLIFEFMEIFLKTLNPYYVMNKNDILKSLCTCVYICALYKTDVNAQKKTTPKYQYKY